MMASSGGDGNRHPFQVALFVTCLIDLFRPSAGFAAVKLLEEAGCNVAVPAAQTCCGQPAYNSGDRQTAKEIAKQVIAAFENYEHIVVPSGSCSGMLCKHYPGLFDPETEPSWHARALAFASRVSELTAFLADILGVDFSGRSFPRRVTYHDSCSSFREMGVAAQPRRLLQSLDGITFVEMSDREVCCGFGGTFSIKYPDISNAMVTQKADRAIETKAEVLTGGDLGCLMNIAGRLAREGKSIEVRHIAEILAGEYQDPGLCAAQ
jgi:L-lactate dehydrogenase complex protein LldE